ncbi:hypothetical protein HL033_01605 [Neoehrlichia mikurensis]|uniref:Uncharacterized protein n=1 Tax=Neoehrlichia mikurensis TaxID=89586 RepID=A0A9Q9F4P6_9RICK|nr:hypothetical protein [Neoehrlichia mikurensis]QXK92238.1 hypothetical protein IAH97_01600 [Neoehrlichia mikurensis]QXK92693.1 hypothetical protein HUN61_01595 [Neoehrlichia mikurensis]QXK93931.1 hypothetical protein HL033_01605 [Neoehrlichia mikurensis]UTO55908.1 hypothetical protein LUA82_02510 [Neoehrlichia mikurensis]UTO56824.1 hypothetical protein LUA81_02490 [Neoehrlichia mikurensis]
MTNLQLSNSEATNKHMLSADIFLNNVDLEALSITDQQYEIQNPDFYIIFTTPQKSQEYLSDNKSANVRILFEDHTINLNNVETLDSTVSLQDKDFYADIKLPIQDYTYDEKPFTEHTNISYGLSRISITDDTSPIINI